MKKFISLALVLTMVSAIFVGCSSSSDTLKDGTYKAEFTEASHGWTEYVVLTVEKEKITKVEFDGLNADGKKKSTDTEYDDTMKNAGFKTWPSDFYPKYATQLVDKQKIDEVEAVTGATSSGNNFKQLVKALEENMKKGKTDVVKVTPEAKK